MIRIFTNYDSHTFVKLVSCTSRQNSAVASITWRLGNHGQLCIGFLDLVGYKVLLSKLGLRNFCTSIMNFCHLKNVNNEKSAKGNTDFAVDT